MKLKPGADARLKRVFADIGVPDKKPFKPDPFQIKALAAVKRSDCLVTAPTGAGKTWIAERAIERIFSQGGRCWYASPLKALTNSKLLEFSKTFGPQHVGILTGDRKENADAPIIVGTTEILRNQLYDAMHQARTIATDFVVLDEAHFLGDPDRGVVWEEVMIYLPTRIPLLMLSATIGNARQIADWLSGIRSKKCLVIEETHRPVPLFPLFLHPSGTLLPLLNPGEPKKKKTVDKKVRAYLVAARPPLFCAPGKLPPFGLILRILRKYRLLPALFFLKSRVDCDNALDLCEENLQPDSPRRQQRSRRILDIVQQHPHIASHRQLWHLEHLAVGAHHSGHLPSWKLTVETLMTEGLLDAVFATSTVAAGVNFPARTVVFLNSDRFNGSDFLPLNSTEFHQMTGRAGRRGMDQIGFAVAVPGKFMDIRWIASLIDSPPTEVQSQIAINFSMVLNLLLSHKPAQIEDLLKNSFATYLITNSAKKKGRRTPGPPEHPFLWRDFLRHLAFLKENGYVTDDDNLSADGVWASQLRIDQPLMVAEGFRRGILPDSDPVLLAAIVSTFVNERESDDRFAKGLLPAELLAAFLKVLKGLKPFAETMKENGFGARPMFLRPAVAIYIWATGKRWEKAVAISESAEGDLASLVLRTADNLRHICALKKVFPAAAKTAAQAIALILRDPVIPYDEDA